MNRCTIVGLSLFACTANPSRLEEISRREQAEAPQAEAAQREVLAMPPAPASLPTLPSMETPPPPGIDAALWRDIGWFPADSVEISGGVGPDNQPLARWAEDSIVSEFPACGPLVAGVQRIYMVQQGDSQRATNVVFGSMTREQERACMQVLLPGLGLSGVQHEGLTVLSRDEKSSLRAGWFRRGEETVVVIEGDAPLERWSEPTGPLDPELVTLLAAVDRTLGMWVAAVHDYGTFFTGVPSSGMTLAASRPTTGGHPVLPLRIGLRFASPSAAEEAERGATTFAATAPSSDGSGLTFSLRADGAWLRVDVLADLSAENGQAFMAWGERALADLRKRAER